VNGFSGIHLKILHVMTRRNNPFTWRS